MKKLVLVGLLAIAPAAFAGISNDDCADAIMFSSLNSHVAGDTSLASTETGFATCGTTLSAPGVWYSFIGDGTTIEITTCGSDITNYDTKINVYCSSCDLPTCVAGNDDGSPSGVTDPNCVIPETGSTANRASFVRFCSQNGGQYYILVQGFNNAVGEFELTIRSDGQPCTGAIACLPTGACCTDSGCLVLSEGDCDNAGGTYYGDNSSCDTVDCPTGACCTASGCSILTEEGCGNVSGSYSGDGTNCGDVSYSTFMACANELEDISGTGAVAGFASSGDDNAEEVPMPFSFTFFGTSYNSVWIGSNGLMQFPPSTEAEADDFSNDPIPSTTLPNRFIAPLWDDLHTTPTFASVLTETRGAAPNRRFIVQWEDVPQLGDGSDINFAMTFQAILFESSNDIEFRYLTVVRPNGGAGDYSIGIENDDGTEGYSVSDASIVSGSCFRIEALVSMNPCDNVEPCPDMDNSGLVDLSDLARLIASFGRSVGDPGYDPVPDFDNSGTVDLSDLALLLSLFGLPCP
ncbi:MAG: hypothetical protein KDA32_00385 [Phycisphaerales bacterium]|nr:hypothetical protein [Phycisphaerales bacterium]